MLDYKLGYLKLNKLNLYYTISINMQSWIKVGMVFNIARKNARVEEYKKKWSKPQRLYARQD